MDIKMTRLVSLISLILIGSNQAAPNNSTIVGTNNCLGYRVQQVQQQTSSSIQAILKLNTPACNVYSEDVDMLSLSVSYTNSRLRVKITDVKKSHFEVPDNLLHPDNKYQPKQPINQQLEFKFQHNPFSFQVIRKSNQQVLFDTTGHRLVFEAQYLELTSKLPKDANIYGIGEVSDKFRRNPDNTIQAMWARDAGIPDRENVYGSHPLYLELRDGLSHGVHILNSYGMDVLLQNQSVGYRVLGGALDMTFLPGPTAYDVMDQYTATFGRPTMIPYWALGFHQCKYGYLSIDEVAEVVHQYKEHNLPLETMWTDIEYMDAYKDFTVDPVNYPLPKVQEFIKKLHSNHQQYILIIDPAISRNESYPAYVDGLQKDVFLKNPDGSNYIGQVWPGYTAFPDWFAPNTQSWWTKHISDFLADVPIDGIWIDMNEPASFCVGSCGSNLTGHPPLPWEDSTYKPDVPQQFKEPNYSIHNFHGNLSIKTVSTEAVHYGGLTEFQVHNLYGHMEAIVTRNSMLEIQPTKRPFILGRSTFTGSGAVEGHWTGDNASTWLDLVRSISGVLSLQLFGIPYTGADICGFGGDTTEELCLRWMQLGSLYPFARNHNAIHKIAQEPYQWKSVADASRRALKVRYELLPEFYTNAYFANQVGAPMWTPLMFEFPNDKNLLDVDSQFLIGQSILASPAVTQGSQQVNATFPTGKWYSYYNYESIQGPTTKVLPAPYDGEVPLHIRGGHIILTQTYKPTIHESRLTNYHMVVAYDQITKSAAGKLYIDDGSSMSVGNNYSNIEIVINEDRFITKGHFGYDPKVVVDKITILGLTKNSKLTRKLMKKNIDGWKLGSEFKREVKRSNEKGVIIEFSQVVFPLTEPVWIEFGSFNKRC